MKANMKPSYQSSQTSQQGIRSEVKSPRHNSPVLAVRRPERRTRLSHRFTAVVLLLLASSTIAVACNIPVFRFALERWRSDPCELIVLHQGVLTADQQSAVQQLTSLSTVNGGHANMDVTLADISDTLPESLLTFGNALPPAAGSDQPYVAVLTKLSRGRKVVSWHGKLQDITTTDLLNSPVRRQLVDRLVAGDAVVWLIIQSDDKTRNSAVRQLLESQFDELSKSIELPEGIGEQGSELYSDIPLLLQFSVLEVDRNDPREHVLVNLVDNLGGDLESSDEPVVVPVFGRGRALEVIPADELSEGLIGDLTRFLCGACSCQVKDLNPGFDLLLQQDWDTKLFGDAVTVPGPPPTGSGQQRKGKPVLVPIPPGRSRK
jgi:hypothetical protein